MDAVLVMALLHALQQQVRHAHLRVSLPIQELFKAEAIVVLAEAVPAEAVALVVVVNIMSSNI